MQTLPYVRWFSNPPEELTFNNVLFYHNYRILPSPFSSLDTVECSTLEVPKGLRSKDQPSRVCRKERRLIERPRLLRERLKWKGGSRRKLSGKAANVIERKGLVANRRRSGVGRGRVFEGHTFMLRDLVESPVSLVCRNKSNRLSLERRNVEC